jgi:L-ribulose-5-phosphate 4-epimerase
MLLQEYREQIVEFGTYLYEAHLVGFADGNISARDPESGLVAVKPTGIPWPKIGLEQVTIIDVNGKIIDGTLKPSSEVPMHTLFYRRRKDVNGVVHCHAPVATAWGLISKEIPSFIVNQGLTKGAVKFAPYTPPGTEMLGETAYDVMGEDGTAVILQSHGILAVGGNLAHAMHVAFAIEDAAKVAMYCKMIGGDPRPFTDEDYRRMYEAYRKKKD